GRGAGGGVRDAGAQRPADALPPAVPRRAVRPRHQRPVLPVHPGHRPAVRPGADAGVPGGAGAPRGDGGAAVNRSAPPRALRFALWCLHFARRNRGLTPPARLALFALALLTLPPCHHSLPPSPPHNPLPPTPSSSHP